MNIFILSLIIEKCARYHCDKHVVKMILEYAQLLSSAHRILDNELLPSFNDSLYKLSHKNHPCAIWTRTSSSNYEWLYSLFIELNKEYTRRYNKEHLSYTKLKDLLANKPKNIPEGPLTPFALAMPDYIKDSIKNLEVDEFKKAVIAYRLYYKYEKKSFATWKTEIPNWFNE